MEKVTVNQAAKLDKYLLPWIDDIFESLEGGKIFSKLDLAHAYEQVPLDEASKKFTTSNTSKRVHHYTAFLLVYLRHQPYFKELWNAFYKVFQMYQFIWIIHPYRGKN